ncbi:MAG TPA: hypothetical protein VN787_08545 [Steroidobacteraceae bacterium]|nr:hypothetical protein [Steroidobacteraceae bacterium]
MKMLKAGTRLKSAVCDTEVMVIRAAAGEVLLACGGAEMIAMDVPKAPGAHPDPDKTQGTLLGKRYADAGGVVELLCTKGGKGGLSIGGEMLSVKQAKPLPSSD